jgi:hypothetical protein
LVLALIAVQAFEPTALEGNVSAIFARLMPPLEQELASEAQRRGWRAHDPTVIRPLLGMITSVAVHDNLLHDGTQQPSHAHIVAHLTGLMLHGAPAVGRSSRASDPLS